MSDNNKGIFKSVFTLTSILIIGKLLGFVREITIASNFGISPETDAYNLAMTINIVIMAIAGTALSTGMVPVLSDIKSTRSLELQNKYLSNISNIIILTTGIFALLIIIIAPYIVEILGSGFTNEQKVLAVELTRIGTPIIVFVLTSTAFSAFLNSREVFGIPAIAGVLNNIIFIVLLFFLKINGVTGLMKVASFAYFCQVLFIIFYLPKQNYKHKMIVDFKDKNMIKTISIMIPIIMGAAVQQINVLIDKMIATSLTPGSISALNYANILNLTILTVFIMAISTIIFPRLANAASWKDYSSMVSTTEKAIRLVILITIPSTIFIVLLADDIVRVIFERGVFDSKDTSMTSTALKFYSIGLIGFGIREVLHKVFYSLKNTRTVMINGIIAVIINILLNFALAPLMGHAGLALATSISGIITTILLIRSLRKTKVQLKFSKVLYFLILILVISLIMGVIIITIGHLINGWHPLIILVIQILIGSGVYVLLSLLARVKEFYFLRTLLKK
ncbi:putative peptidoglycan lipid II flippase [Salirhabdus euzebyi]|uniref:Probable lipid II flippase MurJ n=1 Tax=Salirhabdus euzebyi TaxID=394506 RepID=A0A841Q8A1_9BACI|nr:murein biosynthesis integral membrane protein MurJ [Salirhabdus euzebyi]MBB6454544.1 putative peptidoglycan lipid II flippase [Salirhabdus euzebyi]